MGNTFTDTYGGNTFTGTHSASSGNTFTQAYGSSVPSGGGGSVHHGPSHSGGGFLSGIEGAIGSVVNPPAHVLGNAAGQAAGIIHGIPNSAVTIAEAIKYDFGKGGTESLSQAWHDPHGLIGGVAKPNVEAVHQDASALRRGDWHYFQQHPLNPVLDAATLLSIGGKGALLGAKTGALGTRASKLSMLPRTITVGDHVEELRQAKTLQGRIRQNVFDRYSQAHPDQPLVGVNVRMKKILTARAATQTLRAGLPVRAFQRITGKLSPAEVFAFHVGAEGVPLEDRIAYYQAQLAGASKAARPLQQYLNNLESPAVHDVLTNPRPEFVQALSEGKQLEARAGERLVSAGSLSEETRAERAGLPQRVMLGEADIGGNLVHPDFPAPFRFPHVGKRGNAGLFTTPKTASMLGKAAPLQQLRHNAAVRLRNALLLTDPERVLTTDFLQTMRHETVIQMQREAMDPISQDLSAGLAESGFKKTGEWYYRPSYDRKTTAPIPRHVREAEMLTHDQMILNKDMARTSAEKAGQGIVSEDLRGLGIDARDVHNLERLKELGVRRVPAAFGKDFAKEFGGTHWALRYFYDRPLDVWRAITLNYRPAWAVNNFVGNAIMGLATYGPEGAANYLRVLLSTERGDDKVLRLRNYTMRIPRLRRKYGKVFDEVAPQLHSAGLYGTQTRITHPGVYEGKLAGFTANKAVRALGFAPKKVGRGVLAVGRGVTKVEILLAEDTSREAAFITEAGGDLAKIRSVARKMGEGNLTLAEALKRLDRPSVEKAVRGVSDALGDFNDLSHFERSVVRRLIPFYSWFKVITKVSGKYVARYPARVLLLKNIADAQNAAGEPKLPEWLRGSVLLGGPQGGTQALLSTQGVNPYETLNQVATGGAGSVLSPFATAGIVGLTGRDPSFGTQQDYYGPGHNTRGGWLGQLEQGGGAFLSGLAPARVYSQTTGPYQGKLYAPKTYGHVGPVAINDFLLQYLGIPIRHVKVNEARRESGLK